MVKAKSVGLGCAKRFGPRYGKSNRDNYAKIEILQKATYKCPYCHYQSVTRVNRGIWTCRKCDAKFAGRAYTLGKKISKLSVEEEMKFLEDVEEQNKDQEADIIDVDESKEQLSASDETDE